MITITLEEYEAQHLYDEIAMGASLPMVRGMTRYERCLIRTCRSVVKQLEAAGIHGVLARSWNERVEELDTCR